MPQDEGHVRAQGEDGHLRVKRDLWEKPDLQTLILDFSLRTALRKKFLLFKPPGCDILIWQP